MQMGQIQISPPNPILTIINGNIVTIPFTASLMGQDITSKVLWIYDRPEMGDVFQWATPAIAPLAPVPAIPPGTAVPATPGVRVSPEGGGTLE